MAKIPFDIKLWPEIESGRYKVVTEHGEPVEIVKWDCKGKYPILAVINDGDTDDSCFFGPDGTSPSSKEKLFILTDEPELTEFEKRLAEILDYAMANPVNTSPQIAEQAKKLSPELLGIAYYQFEEKREKDGIVPISKSVLQKLLDDKYKEGYDKGRLDGFGDGFEHAETNGKCMLLHHSFVPPCYVGGPCINPHHDCINCPQQGTSGICKTDTNIK